MKRPKDILSQPYHIQEYINYLERKNSYLHSVSGCSTTQSDDLKEAEKIFEEEEGRKPNWNNSKDELVVSCMQVAISHVRNNR